MSTNPMSSKRVDDNAVQCSMVTSGNFREGMSTCQNRPMTAVL